MLEKKNAPVGTCNLLLVLGMLEDGERAGHEIITALFPGRRARFILCCISLKSAATSAPASVRMADGRAACTV